MEQNKKTAHRKDIAIQTQNFTLNRSQVQQPPKYKADEDSPSKTVQKQKSQAQIIKEYERKITAMSQTILKLNKKNQQQKEQFRILNEKLNKAFTKLTPNKLKISQEKSEQAIALAQQLQRVKKDLENEIKRSKQLKKDIQVFKETQNFLNDADKLTQLRNQLVQKNKQIKQLKETIKVYERAEQNQKKMTHFKKEEELNKKLHQLNEENIFNKKKITQLKTKIEEQQKQRALEKAQNAIEKNFKPKKTDTQPMIKKQIHDEEIHKLQEQIKIYESVKHTLQKTHKQQIDSLRKQNQILNDEVQELKFEIKKKNKEKFILQQRTQQISSLKKSRLQQDRNSLTIDVDDKNQRYKTFSLNLKSESDMTGNGLRKEFLGLSYGNFGNEYKKHDDSTRLNETKSYTISAMEFNYFQEHILSLKTKYKYQNGEEVEIQTFGVDHSYTNVKTVEIIFQEHEYIKELDIYCGKMVEFIQLKTSRNRILEVGNEKNQVKSKKYSFDIKNHQKPVAFGSITQVKKAGEIKKQCLVVFGLIIKRKDISINHKKRMLFSSKDDSLQQKGSLTERPPQISQAKSSNSKEEQNNEVMVEKYNEKSKAKDEKKQKGKTQQNQNKQAKTLQIQKQKQGKALQKKAQKQKSPQKPKQKQKAEKRKEADPTLKQRSKSSIKR